jgi:hypothetical protein
MLRDGLLAVRDVAADMKDDEENVVLSGHPVLPSTWTVRQIAGGWYVVRSDGGTVLHVNRLNQETLEGTLHGLYLVLSEDRKLLNSLASSSKLIDTIERTWSLAASQSGLARDVMRRYPFYSIDGYVRDAEGNAVAVSDYDVRLIPEGGQLPDPGIVDFPWPLKKSTGELVAQADADVRVDAIRRPVFLKEILGYDDSRSAVETEAS